MSRLAPIVVDTDVFSIIYLRNAAEDPRIPWWREYLSGRRVLISFQTRAEVLTGARSARWGERRMARTVNALRRTPTILCDVDVIDAYATLAAACRRIGHALHDKVHTGDRWIAACAIARPFELLAGDQIYRGAPNLVVHS